MPTRRRRPLNFVARGVSDAIDSTNAPPGSMYALSNLIPAPHTRGMFVPRTAAQQLTDFPDYSFTLSTTGNVVNDSNLITSVADTSGFVFGYRISGTGIDDGATILSVGSGQIEISIPASQTISGDTISVNVPGPVTAIFANGSRIYGTITSQTYPGYDEPFCYDVAGQQFIPISGVSTAVLPRSPLAVGDWQPPTMALIGSRIVVTHPGFSGGAQVGGGAPPAFGWFDISAFTLNTLSGNTVEGSNVISNIAGDGTSAPINDGVAPGQTITGAGIPSNTYVTKITNANYLLNTTGNVFKGQALVFNLANVQGQITAAGQRAPQFGDYVTGSGIPIGTQVKGSGSFKVIASGNIIGAFQLVTSADSTNGSNELTNVADTNGIVAGMAITGPGIPTAVTVTAITSNTITMSAKATQTLTNANFAISQIGSDTITSVGAMGTMTKSVTGISTNGSNTLTSVPDTTSIVAGMAITGPNIPAATTVSSVTSSTIVMSANATADAVSQFTITGTATNVPQNVFPGMNISGAGIPQNTYVTQVSGAVITISAIPTATANGVSLTIDAGSVAYLSEQATATVRGEPVNVSGGGSITMSNNATANAFGVKLTIKGGTPQAPLWYAGNCNQNPLPSAPVAVTQFNGRAYFAVKNTVAVSDTLNATQRSNASYELSLGDNQPITALAGLPLENQVIGGIIQAVIAFKGAGQVFQVTGDPATNNWAQNALNQAIGTFSPNSVVPTPRGLAFIAPDGLRIIDFNANIGDPIGAYGQGVSLPFINANEPTRICAAFNQNVLRISVNNPLGSPNLQEWWYDFELDIWTGPHTFPHALITAFYGRTGQTSGHGFVGTGAGIERALFASEATPIGTFSYIENGECLQFQWITSLLPDNKGMSMNAVIESSLGLVLGTNQSVYVTAANEEGDILDSLSIDGITGLPTIWGEFVWGDATWLVMVPVTLWGEFVWGKAPWLTQLPYYVQYEVNWHNPLVFKQMQVGVMGQSGYGFAIGNLSLGYEPLGYMIQAGAQGQAS